MAEKKKQAWKKAAELEDKKKADAKEGKKSVSAMRKKRYEGK